MSPELWAVLGVYSVLFVMLLAAFFFFKYRYRIMRGRIRIRVVGDTGKEKVRVFKTDVTDGEKINWKVFGKERTFSIRQNFLTFSGGEEMPTLTYSSADGEPIAQKRESPAVSSIRYREVATNTVMRDLLESFRKKLINSDVALLITVAAVLLSALILGIFINDKLGSIEELLQTAPVQQNTGVPLE